MISDQAVAQPWYQTLNRTQWNTLLASNLGWLFDGYETYALFLTVGVALRQLLDPSQYPQIPAYAGFIIAITLLGWGIGGLLGGVVADYFGRKRTMMLAILTYSLVTGLSALAWDWTSFALLRFLVGVAIGSEWVTGASIVSELWPDRARGRGVGLMQVGLGIGFFVSSLAWVYIGTMGPNAWRVMFLLGILPALLTLWLRTAIPESALWERVNDRRRAAILHKRRGAELPAHERALARFTLVDLFHDPEGRRRALLAFLMSFATTLGFWGISTWVPPYIASLAGASGPAAAQWAAIGGLVFNAGVDRRLRRVRFSRGRMGPQTNCDALFPRGVCDGAGALRRDEQCRHRAPRSRCARLVRLRAIHLDGGLASGTVSDPDAGNGGSIRLQCPSAHRLGGAADFGSADRKPRRLQPGRDHHQHRLPSRIGRCAFPARDQWQAAATMTRRKRGQLSGGRGRTTPCGRIRRSIAPWSPWPRSPPIADSNFALSLPDAAAIIIRYKRHQSMSPLRKVTRNRLVR